MIEFSILKENEEKAYTEMLSNSSEAMFFHSYPYKEFLEEFLSSKSYYIIAKESGTILGAIPTFIKENSNFGNVLNSSPFFGSNGGFLINSSLDYIKMQEVKKKLLEGLRMVIEDKKCVISTIITSPFDRDVMFYENNLDYVYKDFRIGYIKEFEIFKDNENEQLMDTYTSRCRRAVRKAIKNKIDFMYSDDFKPLFEMHKEGISGKNGLVKPMRFFNLIPKMMKNQFELSYALKQDKIIAGLLLFKFKNIIEYFTPAFYDKYSFEQGTSYLIFKAMKSSVENGYKYWNFGGTGISQTGLSSFKHSWGAKSYPYYYYVTKHGDISKILELSPEEILNEYKWFFVIPFNELNSEINLS